jgi:hypothetical protein
LTPNENEGNFFKDASDLIYNWLSDEERIQLHEELGDGIRSINDLEPNERFFALLRFVEVKYVKITKWIDDILSLLETIKWKDPDFVTEDIVFSETDGEYASLREIQRRLRGAFTEAGGSQDIEALLERLNLRELFNHYVESLKGEKIE